MTRYKPPTSAKTSKKRNKEVRLSAKLRPIQEKDPQVTQLAEKEWRKRHPRKKPKVTPSFFKQLKKKLSFKKKKSKRTGTNAEYNESPPAHIHKEGLRWIKTLTKQCQMQKKKLQKRLSKKSRF